MAALVMILSLMQNPSKGTEKRKKSFNNIILGLVSCHCLTGVQQDKCIF